MRVHDQERRAREVMLARTMSQARFERRMHGAAYQANEATLRA